MDLEKRRKEMEDFFNSKVDSYDDKHYPLMKGKEKVIDFIPKSAKKIIDLGSGTGLQLIKLYKEFPNVETIAIDVSSEMLKKLKERNISDKIIIVNNSFFDYDFGKDVDVVMSTQALHHFNIEDKKVLYKKVYNCLKKDGVFVNEDYFADTDEIEKQGFFDYENLVRGEGKHYDTPLTMEHEIDILKQVGFENVDTCIDEEYRIIIANKRK